MEKKVKSPWPAPVVKEAIAEAAKTPSAASGVKEITAEGVWRNSAEAVAAQGFHEGVKIHCVSTNVPYTVKVVSPDAVVLQDNSGRETSHAHAVFLEGQYKVRAAEKDFASIAPHTRGRPTAKTL